MGGSCPFEGKYGSLPDVAGCQLEATGGCEDKSRLDITSSCQAHPGITPSPIHNVTNTALVNELVLCVWRSIKRFQPGNI